MKKYDMVGIGKVPADIQEHLQRLANDEDIVISKYIFRLIREDMKRRNSYKVTAKLSDEIF